MYQCGRSGLIQHFSHQIRFRFPIWPWPRCFHILKQFSVDVGLGNNWLALLVCGSGLYCDVGIRNDARYIGSLTLLPRRQSSLTAATLCSIATGRPPTARWTPTTSPSRIVRGPSTWIRTIARKTTTATFFAARRYGINAKKELQVSLKFWRKIVIWIYGITWR